MVLTPDEREEITDIGKGVARIEVHIKRMDTENKDKFKIVHKRIDVTRTDLKDELKSDARNAGLIAGAAVVSAALAAAGALFLVT